jgi:Domain of unknown function (DUF6457)
MNDWIDGLAEALGVEALSSPETERILRVARDVAHRVERKDTPLAAFLLGMDVARRTTSGTARGVALDDAIATMDALLPPATERP